MPYYMYAKPILATWTMDKGKNQFWELIPRTPVILLAAAKVGGFGG